MRKAVVLFSGGIDSTTALYWAMDSFSEVTALSFDYGQRHKIELRLGRRLTRHLHLPHSVLTIDLGQVGGSSLTDPRLPLPRFKSIEEIGPGVPITYVPFRNGIFLALAAAWAEVHKIRTLVCGFNTIDSPHYPDTRIPFIKAMDKAVALGTRPSEGGRLRLLAPFVRMKKAEIIRTGLSLGADYSYSISCYAGKEVPCRTCSSCLLRQRAWQEAGVKDHLLIRLKKEGKL